MKAPSPALTIGILDLQGCVQEHIPHLEKLGCHVLRVRSKEELELVGGLIIPGGESTTQLKLIDAFGLEEALITRAQEIPFWGICAGAILMASEVVNPEQKSLKLMDVSIGRNAFGRQLESFNQKLRGEPVSFIRAPRVTRVSSTLQTTDFFEDEAVHVIDPETGHQISTFHPELNPNAPSVFHKEFVDRCLERKRALLISPRICRAL